MNSEKKTAIAEALKSTEFYTRAAPAVAINRWNIVNDGLESSSRGGALLFARAPAARADPGLGELPEIREVKNFRRMR